MNEITRNIRDDVNGVFSAGKPNRMDIPDVPGNVKMLRMLSSKTGKPNRMDIPDIPQEKSKVSNDEKKVLNNPSKKATQSLNSRINAANRNANVARNQAEEAHKINEIQDYAINELDKRLKQETVDRRNAEFLVQRNSIMGVFRDFQTTLEMGTKEDIALRHERNLNLFIDEHNTAIFLSSYGQESAFSLSTLFLWKFGLDQDTLYTSNYEKDKLKAILWVMNIMNRGKSMGSKIVDKSADNFRPFHVDSMWITAVEVENWLEDDRLIKVSSLESYAKPLGVSARYLADLIVKDLNYQHLNKYAPNASTNMDRVVGR